MAYVDYVRKIRNSLLDNKFVYLCEVLRSSYYGLPYRLNPYYYLLDFHIRCILDQWNRDHPDDNGKFPVRTLTPYLRLKYLGEYDADKFRAMGITMSEGTLLRKMWLTDIIQHEAETYKSPRGFFSILWVVLKIKLDINSTFVGISFNVRQDR